MRRDRGVLVSRWVAFLAVGVFALLLHVHLALAIPIGLDSPASTPPTDLNVATHSTSDIAVAGETVAALAPEDNPIEQITEPSSLLYFGTGLVGVAGIAWRRHRRG